MRQYCDYCHNEEDVKIVNKDEVYPVYGDEISVKAQVMVCMHCGNELYSRTLDNQTLKKVYDVYRSKHKLLFPNEIKAIRKQYCLSQRAFSKLLNWGDKTIVRYENGSLQDYVHNALLLFLRNPVHMEEYLQMNENSLSPKDRDLLFKRIKELCKQNNTDEVGKFIDTLKNFHIVYSSDYEILERGYHTASTNSNELQIVLSHISGEYLISGACDRVMNNESSIKEENILNIAA